MSAAIRGTKRDVQAPSSFSILTNIVAFIPLLFIPGRDRACSGGRYRSVVIIVLTVSLLEALYILPAHLAHAKRGTRTHGSGSVA